jgi:hypothetical protein
MGITAIGDSPEQAHEIYLGAVALLDRLAAKTTRTGRERERPGRALPHRGGSASLDVP